jgi:hypothetical protein
MEVEWRWPHSFPAQGVGIFSLSLGEGMFLVVTPTLTGFPSLNTTDCAGPGASAVQWPGCCQLPALQSLPQISMPGN